MTIKLLIARHGNTFGPEDVVTRIGTTDLPLVESGLIQGQKLGIYLKQNNLIPDVIFTAQLKRTRQTAEEAKKAMQIKLPINTLSIFNEIDYGIDENQPEEKVIARVGVDALKDWESHAIVPNGWKVDPHDIIKRWQTFSTFIRTKFAERIILVVTSSGIARFAPYLTGNFNAFIRQYNIKISTGTLCIFESLPSEHWQCLSWNLKI